jgi:predicted NUDIX family NTP pyrophosphohydrolase
LPETPVRRTSAGIVLYRRRAGGLEVLLVHPGGPFWKNKDEGSWSIPKGENLPGEDLLETAKREFLEETGLSLAGAFTPLGEVRQSAGKRVFAWAVQGDADPAQMRSITFQMEWPPRSGKYADFPEVDRAEWFTLEKARKKILPGQSPLLNRLEAEVQSRR